MSFTAKDHFEYKFWNAVSNVNVLSNTKLRTKAELEKSYLRLKACCSIMDKAKELGVDIL